MSHLIAAVNRPCLVLCHNKTLAAQLVRELRSFLGATSAVELFVSYYNHYVPEAFVEATNKYIGKKSSVCSAIDALRHRATLALVSRRDVVVVATVSCIYGLGLPDEYLDMRMSLHVGMELQSASALSEQLVTMLYQAVESDDALERGQFTESCDLSTILTLWPPHERFPMQIFLQEQSGGGAPVRIESIRLGTESGMRPVSEFEVFPAKHHVVSEPRLRIAMQKIEDELHDRVNELRSENKKVEAERLQQRVTHDLMMLRDTGFCSGGENYSRHLAGREAGVPPSTLLDYMGIRSNGEWLLLMDESHVTLPQLGAMYNGDQARKRRLVKHGYRLPSALDNRPLKGEEFWERVVQTVFVSATPGRQELEWTGRDPVEMIIRPTYVADPVLEVRPKSGQLEDLLQEVKSRAALGQKTLAVALTKRDAEDLSSLMVRDGVSSAFIHSGLTTRERSDALKSLQTTGEVDCLVGVNLLREGLDLPQVSLVAILNADSEGFLRSETSLTQTVGRAARHCEGKAIYMRTV
jgi:excinuclease ABC subunit B